MSEVSVCPGDLEKLVEGVEVPLSLLLGHLKQSASASASASIFAQTCLPHETFPADNYLCGLQWDRLNNKFWINMVFLSPHLWNQSWCPCICQIWTSCHSCWSVHSQTTRGCHSTEKKGCWINAFLLGTTSHNIIPKFSLNNSQIQFWQENVTWRSTSFTLSISPCWATLVIWGEERRWKFLLNPVSDFFPFLCCLRLHWWIEILSLVPGLQLILPAWAYNCSALGGLFTFNCSPLSEAFQQCAGLFRARSFLQLFRPQCWSTSGQPSNQCTFLIKPVCQLNLPLKYFFGFVFKSCYR